MEQEVDHEMHEPSSFFTKYVWSQDHKVIAIQYSVIAILVGIVALVLSGWRRADVSFSHC